MIGCGGEWLLQFTILYQIRILIVGSKKEWKSRGEQLGLRSCWLIAVEHSPCRYQGYRFNFFFGLTFAQMKQLLYSDCGIVFPFFPRQLLVMPAFISTLGYVYGFKCRTVNRPYKRQTRRRETTNIINSNLFYSR